MDISVQVRPLGGNRYEVRKLRTSDRWALTYFVVIYQPSDGWKPEIASCECLRDKIYSDWPCKHVQAVIEFRRRGEG